MRAMIAFLSGICFLVAIPTVQAWNKPGHMTSAAIAYADLKERSPAVLVKVIEVLKQHPQFESKWAPKLVQVSASDRDLSLFMLAASWPDDVRKEYPKGWHFINIPYRPGESDVTIPDGANIIEAFSKNRSIVRSTTSSAQDRAKAPCWLLHGVGDIHQPLHSTKLVTEKFPEPDGDRGGNLFFVRYAQDNPTVKLHALWDGLILSSAKFQAARNKAVKLRNRPDLSRDKLAEELAVQDFTDWAKASHKLAIEHVYLNGSLQPSTNENDGVLPSDYHKNSAEIANRLIVLAGYRISNSMIHILGQ